MEKEIIKDIPFPTYFDLYRRLEISNLVEYNYHVNNFNIDNYGRYNERYINGNIYGFSMRKIKYSFLKKIWYLVFN